MNWVGPRSYLSPSSLPCLSRDINSTSRQFICQDNHPNKKGRASYVPRTWLVLYQTLYIYIKHKSSVLSNPQHCHRKQVLYRFCFGERVFLTREMMHPNSQMEVNWEFKCRYPAKDLQHGSLKVFSTYTDVKICSWFNMEMIRPGK